MREVTVTFHLSEHVTPELFAEKVALACARGNAIRVGEWMSLDDAHGGHAWIRPRNIDIPAGVIGRSEIKDVPTVEKMNA